MKIELNVTAKSPIHLSSGQADVNVDADVIHDRYGMPYFPGRRFKGLLYESALEVREMGCRSGYDKLLQGDIDVLFHHDTDEGDVQLIVPNLYLAKEEEYRALCSAWAELQKKYASLLTPQDVLLEYTSIRYQTRLVDGVAAKGSLHNMRVVDDGTVFTGVLELRGEDASGYLFPLAAAVRNLKVAGLKRNRGFGSIQCRMKLMDGSNRTEEDIIREALA
ncbi:MAG: hypothetical protein IJT01_08795 [Selenomonadaceae bacterium]|nr:hypothetical protein [Selenomonadaceae bacterium]